MVFKSRFELLTSQVEMTPDYETETWKVRTANLKVKYGYKATVYRVVTSSHKHN
jgi:hypothetical protein